MPFIISKEKGGPKTSLPLPRGDGQLIFPVFGIKCGPMARVFYFAFCTAGMVGVWWLCKTAVVSTSSDFSDGLFVGFFAATFLIWAAEKVDKSQRR